MSLNCTSPKLTIYVYFATIKEMKLKSDARALEQSGGAQVGAGVWGCWWGGEHPLLWEVTRGVGYLGLGGGLAGVQLWSTGGCVVRDGPSLELAHLVGPFTATEDLKTSPRDLRLIPLVTEPLS